VLEEAAVRISKLERDYQTHVLTRVRDMLPGCITLKNDSGYQQGIPDWSVLWFNFWAFLEIKRSFDAEEQVNQRFFVERASEMCFGAFIYPENEEEVLNALCQASRSYR
jgi:hypothetical protein